VGSKVSEGILDYDVVVPARPLAVRIDKDGWSVEGVRILVQTLWIGYLPAHNEGVWA